jgi:hypothetical protein
MNPCQKCLEGKARKYVDGRKLGKGIGRDWRALGLENGYSSLSLIALSGVIQPPPPSPSKRESLYKECRRSVSPGSNRRQGVAIGHKEKWER